MAPPNTFYANLAKAEKEREAESDRRRGERQLWAMDALPAAWSEDRKQRYREREVLLEHARNVALPAGRITECQYSALVADIAQQELGDMDMNEYLAATGRARNAHGRVVDIDRDAPCHLDLVRKRAALESSGDPRDDARLARDARNRVVASTGYELNRQGIIDDAGYGELLRTSDAVPDALRDPDGTVLVDNATLGNEMFIANSMPDEYQPGDILAQERKEQEEKRVAADPALKARREAERDMKVSEKFAQEWRKRDLEHRLAGTRSGRERLAERQNVETLREVASDLAQGNMPTEAARERLAKIARPQAIGPSEAEAVALVKGARRGESDPALGILADALALADKLGRGPEPTLSDILSGTPSNANPAITQNHSGGDNG